MNSNPSFLELIGRNLLPFTRGGTTSLFTAPLLAALVLAFVSTDSLRADQTAFAAPKTVTIQGRDMLAVGFEHLASFPYILPTTASEKKPVIPDTVRSLDKKRVAITGYLLPMQLENGLAKQAILMRSQMTCCYGAAPNFNEYVIITMRGPGIRPLMDTPVTLIGTLSVGESYEEGYFVGIYQMDCEQLIESTLP